MTKRVVHVSEAEAANDFRSLIARVRAGEEVVIESGERPVAVLHAAEPQRRTISEYRPSQGPRRGSWQGAGA